MVVDTPIVAEYVIFRFKYAKIRVFGALRVIRIKYVTQYVRPDSNTGGLPKKYQKCSLSDLNRVPIT